MISFIHPEYNANGNIKIAELSDSKLNDSTRRVTRRATINGGVYLDDNGFSHGDRTFEIKAKATPGLVESVDQLKINYSQYKCLTNEGVFNGVIQSTTIQDDVLNIKFYVQSLLN